ncbi:uncharacterized protein LOC144152871 isoform X2 [Haemaphysalis longicornis]
MDSRFSLCLCHPRSQPARSDKRIPTRASRTSFTACCFTVFTDDSSKCEAPQLIIANPYTPLEEREKGAEPKPPVLPVKERRKAALPRQLFPSSYSAFLFLTTGTC